MESNSFYLNAAGHSPLLSPLQEIELGRAVQAWIQHPDYPAVVDRVGKRGRRAKERIVAANMRLVVYVAKKFERRLRPGCGMDFADLLQEGHLGLIRAVEKFDPGRGYKFSTYAYWWVRQSMQRAFEVQSRHIRVPSGVMASVVKVNRAIRELSVTLGRLPTRHEVADAIGLTHEQFDYYLHIQGKMIHLDSVSGLEDSEQSVSDVIADPSSSDQDAITDRLQLNLWGSQVRAAWSRLHGHEQALLTGRYGLDGSPPKTLAELRDGLGISREATRLRLLHAERKLRFLAANTAC